MSLIPSPSLLRLGTCLAAGFAGLCPPASSQQAPVSPSAMPTLRASSRIVYVDVIVRDGNGNIVHGLQEGQFRLAEDRHPQKISLFEPHTAPAPAAVPSASAEGSSDPSTGEPVEITNVPRTARDTSLNIILLDLLNSSPQDQAYARTRMIAFLRAVPPGRQVALFTLTDGLHMIQNFTIDSGLLAKAADAINPRQLNRLRTPGQALADRDMSAYIDFASSGGTWGQQNSSANSLGGKIQTELQREDIQNMRTRLDATNRAFTELARAVNGYAGRKNLFWLAGQFPSSVYYSLESLSTSLPRVLAGSPGAGVAGQLPSSGGLALGTLSERADRAIADSQIAVYPISLVGVQTDLVGAESNGIGSTASNAGATAAAFFNERATGREVMNRIADETGGEAFFGNNDPAALLRRGFDDGENFYRLAYQPTNHQWNGQLRGIHVSVPGGYSLSYRRSYLALPEQPAAGIASGFASAMRMGSPPSSALALRAAPPVIKDGVLHMDANIDLQGVGLTVDDTGNRRGRLQVRMVAYPVDKPAAAVELNSALKLGFTDEDYKTISKSGIPIRQTMHLPPGQFLLRLGVLDMESGRVGTLTLPISVSPVPKP